MRFDMKLDHDSFNEIAEGRKSLEFRLNDEKRQKIRVGDLIFFHRADNEYDVLKCKVKALYHADSFKKLFEELCVDKNHEDMRKYYSTDKEKEYGVLGIEIEKYDDLYLVDGHMHLEYGPLNKEYALRFIEEGINKGLDEIDILDHTHRFKEFEPCYEHLRKYPEQDEWLKQPTKFCNTLDDYYKLIEELRKMEFPIKVKFGLEVCYTSNTEELLRDIVKDIKLDFLTGAIHSVNSILYDMSFSKKLLWDVYPADDIYKWYYDEILSLIRSGLFNRLAHPDQIKLLNIYPSYSLKETFREIADGLNEKKMYGENNTGIHYRYGHNDIGISDELLKIFKDKQVRMVCASDAHKPEHVGSFIPEAAKRNKGVL